MTKADLSGTRHAAGVIGVGSVGSRHARVYRELPTTTLAGVSDIDPGTAARTADEYRTAAMDRSELLEAVDIASVAVPTGFHYAVVRECIDHGVDVLVEGPFVDDIQRGHELATLARKAGVTVQVGHVERFDPVTQVLSDIVRDLEVLAVDIERFEPFPGCESEDSVVRDLLIGDLGILFSLVDGDISRVSAVGRDGRFVASQFEFDDDSLATVTAGCRTQETVRRVAVDAESCRVTVDFVDQSVAVHRRSLPQDVESDGDIRYRCEGVVERPVIETGEPLRAEIAAFVDAVRTGSEPEVTPADALELLRILDRIETDALDVERAVIVP